MANPWSTPEGTPIGLNASMAFGCAVNIMQIWVFFDAGAGGDGFVNLLEHSKNIVTLDHNENVHATPLQQFWRVHRFVDNTPKFWAAAPDVNECFRSGSPFFKHTNKLRSNYLDIVTNDYNTIFSGGHDATLASLEDSDLQNILTKNQIKIYLHNSAIANVQAVFNIKHLAEYNIHTLQPQAKRLVQFKKFDYVIDVNELLTSWNTLKLFVTELRLSLDEKHFDEFNLIQQHLGKNILYSGTTPEFQSSIDIAGNVTYQQLEISL